MSYTQSAAAIDACLIMATADISSMDPDEIEQFARQCIADGKCIRDDFDENGYEKTNYGTYECGACGGTAVYTDAYHNGSYCASCATQWKTTQ